MHHYVCTSHVAGAGVYKTVLCTALNPRLFLQWGAIFFSMAGMKVLIDDVWINTPLYLVTLPGIWHFKNYGKFGYNNQGGNNTWLGKQDHGAKIPTNAGNFGGRFVCASTPPSSPDPYITTSGVIPQQHTSGGRKGQGSGWQQPTPDPCHPTFCNFMNRFLQCFGGMYLIKALNNSGIKKPLDIPKL